MNTNNSDNSEDLLGKYLAQETDAQENALIEKWLQESEENQKELDDFSFIWDNLGVLKEEHTPAVDVDAAWLKVKSKMDSPKDAKIVPLTPVPKKSRFFTLGIAASITVLLTVGLLFYFFNYSSVELISLKTTQNTLEQTLPDGSIVFLNNYTSLTYPENFDGDTREISMTGEAFFDIKRDETKPFVIHANGSEIKVLGTSFNIKAYDKNVKVSVETGKVQFANKAKATILVAGEQATFEAEKDTIKKQIIADKNTFAYKTKVFVFDNASLEYITNVLAQGYHANIRLQNEGIKSCRLTTKFENESLADALNIIAETLNLTVSAKDSAYVLDGKACTQ